jgi:heme-degrading monooxygenase HmoA
MISRQWTCILKEESSDQYVNFLNKVVFTEARELPGFIEASICKRNTKSGLEFMITTLWEDLNAIKAFAGENLSIAMVPEEAQQMMVSFDKTVKHYEVVSKSR